MAFVLSSEMGAILVAIVVLAGALNGLAGFGFALVATMAVASVLDPATAVVLLIIPILAINLSLARDLSPTQLRTCGRRFGPLLAAALVGTILGTVGLARLPARPLQLLLGVISIGFVVSAQDRVVISPLERAREGCFVESLGGMVAIGGVSGLIFGGTNVGVQLVAFLRSCNLSHGLFVGVVALVFLGLNAVRVGLAATFGLYPSTLVAALSITLVVPAVIGVRIGVLLRDRVTPRNRERAVLALLTIVGLRLLASGLGVA